MVTKIAFLYFASMAWGCLVLLPLVKLREVGQGFYRFFGFTCVALDTLAVGLALFSGPEFEPAYRQAAWALGASLFFTLCFTIALKVRVRWFLWTCFMGALLAGLPAIAYWPWEGQGALGWLAVRTLSSALLLGSVTLAMMLGHWYLVTPKLSIAPLKRYSNSYILLTVWMALLIAGGYWSSKAVQESQGLPLFVREEFIFILFRVAWGLLPPLGMAYWIWETVRTRSTQSATGILYAAMVCTLMGEAMGLYLTLRTGLPF
ncbi:MAG TPA: hypothetical protein VHE12_01935 [bacterium]|nr:hypothetical protein [bacterium]